MKYSVIISTVVLSIACILGVSYLLFLGLEPQNQTTNFPPTAILLGIIVLCIVYLVAVYKNKAYALYIFLLLPCSVMFLYLTKRGLSLSEMSDGDAMVIGGFVLLLALVGWVISTSKSKNLF